MVAQGFAFNYEAICLQRIVGLLNQVSFITTAKGEPGSAHKDDRCREVVKDSQTHQMPLPSLAGQQQQWL